ncbi:MULTISPECIES: F0F1 ATP synthase subunit B [Anaerovibrio]|uniref:ATP synthase subunit b n=2 Tax=Anaerovibrio lipolyticus TaxID=82374 RepID=A0A0B2K0M2_9FIRM|nr:MULTISPECIES: F0F1 ATP synthase subunit B [Anaerovibrio]KHM52371.1 ATP synthase F0 subunit B [Anaerovibrio lipolyticus]SHI90439.1 F-type H+-transporting ATPase subunit b [Anaerovibrio lipolyticus DSM 3074]
MIDINATLIAQMLNFLVLVVLLRIFAYKPIVKMLKEREERIAGSIKKADDDAAAAEATLKQYQEQLAGARVKAQEIIDKAEKRTREDHEASMQTTKAEIDQMKHAAQQEIQRERALAVEKLKGQVAALSIAAAEKIVSKNIDAAENEALIKEFIDQLDKDKIGDLPC